MGNSLSIEDKIHTIVYQVSETFPEYINLNTYDISHDLISYNIIKNLIDLGINMYTIKSSDDKIINVLKQLIEFDMIVDKNYSKMYNNIIDNINVVNHNNIPKYIEVIDNTDKMVIKDIKEMKQLKSKIQSLKMRHQNEIFELIDDFLHKSIKVKISEKSNTTYYVFLLLVIIVIVYIYFNEIKNYLLNKYK
jgi:hypothetical protein